MKFLAVAVFLSGVLLQSSVLGGAPYKPEEYRKFRETCGKILRTSPETRNLAEQGQFVSDSSEMHCLVRCVGIMTNFYDDESGTNWDLVAQQMQGKKGFEEHRQATTACTSALTEADYGNDVCKKSYMHFRCAMKSHNKHIKPKDVEE